MQMSKVETELVVCIPKELWVFITGPQKLHQQNLAKKICHFLGIYVRLSKGRTKEIWKGRNLLSPPCTDIVEPKFASPPPNFDIGCS